MMERGKIRFFNQRKGFGFIIPDAGGEDIMVHSARITDEVRNNLDVGVEVLFEAVAGPKGLLATDCILAVKSRFNVIRISTTAGNAIACEDRVTGDSTLCADDEQLKQWQRLVCMETDGSQALAAE